MTSVHPSDQHFYLTTQRDTGIAGLLCMTVAWVLLVSGCMVQERSIKNTLFATGLVTTTAARRSRRVTRRTEGIIQDSEDISDQSRQNRFYEAFKPTQPAIVTVSAHPTEPTNLFDWQEFKTSPNKFPHIMVEGATGSGKTALTEFILDLLPGERLVITPKRRVSQWQGLTVVGTPLKFPVIQEALELLLDKMQKRYEQIDQGVEDFSFLNFVVDEYPLVAANCDGLSETMMMLVRAAREASMRMLLIAQGSEGKALDIEGQTSVRECFCRVRLGKLALDHAKKLKDPNLLQWLSRQDRPCMVDDRPAIVPDLAGFHISPQPALPSFPGLVDPPTVDPETAPSNDEKVRQLIGEGKTKVEIIWEVWHCKPGRGKDYAKAKREYERIMKRLKS
jgi:hypothetical protein